MYSLLKFPSFFKTINYKVFIFHYLLLISLYCVCFYQFYLYSSNMNGNFMGKCNMQRKKTEQLLKNTKIVVCLFM